VNDSGSFLWFVPSLISPGEYSIIVADAARDSSKSELFTIVSVVTGNTALQSMVKASSSQSAQVTPASTISYSTSTGKSSTTPQANNSPSVTAVTGGNSNVGSIVGGVSGGVGVLALMIGGMYLIHRHAKKHIIAGSDHLPVQDAGTTNVETTVTKTGVQHTTLDSRV
jgi:hypothetical protein